MPVRGIKDEDWGKVDGAAIDAHVIPNQVLFTRTIEEGKKYPTASYVESIKINIRMQNIQLLNGTKISKSKNYLYFNIRCH